jgi:hypothetical protein
VRSLSSLGRSTNSKAAVDPPITELTLDELRERFEITETSPDKLRTLKAKALQSHTIDLDEADAIQRIIDLTQTDNSGQILGTYEQWLQEAIDEALFEMDTQLREVDSEMDEIEFKYRAEIDELFTEMQQTHIEELAKLEYDRSVEQLKAEKRVSAEERMLRKQARDTGADGKMDDARKYKSAAERQRADDLAAAEAQIQQKYKSLCDHKLAQYCNALAATEAEFNAQLETKNRIRDGKSDDVKRRTSVFIKSQLQRAIVGASEKIAKVKARRDVKERLTKFVRDILKTKGKEFLLD